MIVSCKFTWLDELQAITTYLVELQQNSKLINN